ncbi:MAG: hypothetical protein UX72_C0046G0006 [Parcubacteria group bacterium GW2011_GWA2_47_10]|nr:MAG: hypothetical protein UX72_C0046G0006 [Parcubacteria group bacterium GW2011_GWA2_47_10]
MIYFVCYKLWSFHVFVLTSEVRAERPYYDSPSKPVQFNQWDGMVLGFNVALGCSMGAIPSLWRGENASKTLEQCAKGSIGGTLIYAGEKAASYSTTPGIGWAAHGLVAVGSSVRENVAQNYDLFERVAFDLAFMRLSIGSQRSNHGSTFQAYALLGPFAGIWANLAQGNSLNWQASLYNGNLIFEATKEQYLYSENNEEASYGIANVITIRREGYKLRNGTKVHYDHNAEYNAKSLEHEQIHAVMYREFGSTDVLLEEWQKYDWFKQRFHLSLGGDLGYATIVGISAPFPHHQRASEWNALNLDQE